MNKAVIQCARCDGRNRNQIKTPQGDEFLAVPVQVKGKHYQDIKGTFINGTEWAVEHWKALVPNYRRCGRLFLGLQNRG